MTRTCWCERFQSCQCQPCPECGVASWITMTEEQLLRWNARYETGEFVQHIFPDWTPDQRELLLTGTHPACWDAMLGPDL